MAVQESDTTMWHRDSKLVTKNYFKQLSANLYNTIPAATLILRLCLVPTCGISTKASDKLISDCCTPSTSLPNITANLSFPFHSKRCKGILFFTCSTDII